jgi:hypothetical protein
MMKATDAVAVELLANSRYGGIRQLLKAAEEFSEAARACVRLVSASEELDAAMARALRPGEAEAAVANFVEELADVSIMVEQAAVIVRRLAGERGVVGDFITVKNEKLLRLEARLAAETKRGEFPDSRGAR